MDSDVIAHGGGWSDSGESILTGWASGDNEERRVWCLEKARSMPARCSSAMAVGGGRRQAEEGCVAGGGRRQTEERGCCWWRTKAQRTSCCCDELWSGCGVGIDELWSGCGERPAIVVKREWE
ncbi:HTH-type transcriptional regulator MlrA [Striga asiatica]|uniref:HTH-type transcriptional regulator MlrA n=1 Tax=Striga asiatica TaxID=4170 RepID=A0A5A7QW53_STRAF|nr:HTH-type transcriptional regulator MlrA [Striga asiatica]